MQEMTRQWLFESPPTHLPAIQAHSRAVKLARGAGLAVEQAQPALQRSPDNAARPSQLQAAASVPPAAGYK
jgi:hypothetical protein